MCGIAGIVDGEHRMKYRNQQAVEDMLDTMKRRGPDQQNIYTDEAVTTECYGLAAWKTAYAAEKRPPLRNGL